MNILNNKKIENSLFLGVHVHKNYHLCAYVHMCVQACGLGPECKCQRSVSSVFVRHCPACLLKQGLSRSLDISKV